VYSRLLTTQHQYLGGGGERERLRPKIVEPVLWRAGDTVRLCGIYGSLSLVLKCNKSSSSGKDDYLFTCADPS
jgi:hypothetical protein